MSASKLRGPGRYAQRDFQERTREQMQAVTASEIDQRVGPMRAFKGRGRGRGSNQQGQNEYRRVKFGGYGI